MNTFASIVAVALLLAGALPLRAAAPALSIEKAVELAQASLKERGLDRDFHLVAVTLEPATMMRSRFHWFARWSRAIPREDRKQEIGLQIGMDGRVVHIIKAPARAQGRRTNQASILDLRGH